MAYSKNAKKDTFTVTDNLRPAEIITDHIRRIMEADNVPQYVADIEKLEDLLSTEMDEPYEKAEKDIESKVDEYHVPRQGKMSRAASDEFRMFKEAKKGQYRKRLVFRELVKLAKRKGLWLMDEEDAFISHDKKKVTSTG